METLEMTMKAFRLALVFCLPLLASAQAPVKESLDHAKLLSSSNPKLAVNKKVVYDFWREVLEGGHVELTDKYLTEGFIEHNPTVPTGREGFKKFFAAVAKPKTIDPRVKKPLVAIMAEDDLVTLVFVEDKTDPKGKKYTTTWFDMFRVENGKISQHWDPEVID